MADIAPFTGARSIGQYFLVVSFVPSTVFVAYLTLLVHSGAWSGTGVHMAGAIGGLGLRDLALFGVASLVLALALHPLQFVVIQIFEGYWGISGPALRLALANVMRHRRRAQGLYETALNKQLQAYPHPMTEPYAAQPGAAKAQVKPLLHSAEAWRLYGSYPDQIQAVMPTRLGNVLRRYEYLAGAAYGLDSLRACRVFFRSPTRAMLRTCRTSERRWS